MLDILAFTAVVVSTFTRLSAHPSGARGLAYTSAALHQAPSGSPSGSSLVHVVLDDCQRHLDRRSADGGAVQRLAVSFSLLAAAALVQEGRAIICRVSHRRLGDTGLLVGLDLSDVMVSVCYSFVSLLHSSASKDAGTTTQSSVMG